MLEGPSPSTAWSSASRLPTCERPIDPAQRLAAWVAGLLAREDVVRLPSLPSSAEAWIAWETARTAQAPVLCVRAGDAGLEALHQDLATLAPDPKWATGRLFYLAPREPRTQPLDRPDPEIAGLRLRALEALGEASEPAVVAASVRSLLQPTLPPTVLRGLTLSLEVGVAQSPESAAERLVCGGYRPAALVEEKGQFARRGGLLDVWPSTDAWPLRVEFADNAVASMRRFDPATQRSIAQVSAARVIPASDTADGLAVVMRPGEPLETDPISLLPPNAVVLVCDVESARDQLGRLPGDERARQALARLLDAGPGRQIRTGCPDAGDPGLDWRPIPALAGGGGGGGLWPDVSLAARRRFLADLERRAGSGQRVVIFFDTPGAEAHFREQHALQGVETRVGVLSEGFISDGAGWVVVAEADLRGRRKVLGRRYDPLFSESRPQQDRGPRLADLEDLEPGDLVVHQAHGIGRYLGIFEIVVDGQRQEVVTLEYEGGARLHVPVSQAHLLSRYAGLTRRAVKLHRLGGRRWKEEKSGAERAVSDLAAQLIETQAQRSLLPGHAFPPDHEWQREFEASFPYRETEDQERAIADVKKDMEAARPADRLICGDAGYGKTEVALRAAFKAVLGAKQVAVLVPTTVLAQQHFRTFTDRMADYPIRVEMLSRFRSRRERLAVLDDLAEGRVDVLIGTHALLQPSVRFRDLGLVIIDEEQRFGVRHKERLKELRKLVDVLTLTATPIPRTLYLSLVGARDISLIRTPPAERMTIETIVTRDRDDLVRDAIRRELQREGQVFFLHNRIATIERVRERLARLVPEARIEVAHGRMPANELAGIMRRFADGRFDVLLCTTLVESGMDIPRANTILVDRADRFGLSDLYQLRGRVGRSSRQAYALFLLPPEGCMDAQARARLMALRAHTEPGAGFNIALRDLELRGAGNLLGEEQSGHIAAVGFGLYCQLLRRTVARLKGEPLPPIIETEVKLDFLDASPRPEAGAVSAALPYNYVEDERLRIGLYRRLAEAATIRDVRDIEKEIEDRFGPPPPPVRRLVAVTELRILAHAAGWTRVEVRRGRVFLWRGEELANRPRAIPRLAGTSPDQKLQELLAIARKAASLSAPDG